MPTLVYVDGFEHQTLSGNQFAVGSTGLFDGITVAGSSIVTPGRTGTACLQISPVAAVCRVYKLIPGTDPTVTVSSFYIRFPNALPVADCVVGGVGTAGGGQGRIWFNAATSKFHIHSGATKVGLDVGPVLEAGRWYRVDYRINVGANPWVIDCQIDGGTNVQHTIASTATVCDAWVFGNDNAAYTYTAQYDDFVSSNTSADYPIGPHRVLAVVPTADGTHAAGTNVMENEAGTDIGVTPAWSELDEVPATTAGYVQQVAVGASNYAEVTFPDSPETIIWGAVAYAALFASGTVASATAITRIVDAANATLVDVYSGDMSETVLHYRSALIPGIDTLAELNGLKARVGFASVVTSVPRWSALMVQYAVPGEAPSSVGVKSGWFSRRTFGQAWFSRRTQGKGWFGWNTDRRLLEPAAGIVNRHDSINSTTDTTTYSGAAAAPPANQLIVAVIHAPYGNTFAAGAISSISGYGLTWTLIGSKFVLDVAGATFRDMWLYAANTGASATSAAFSLTFSDTRQGCQVSIFTVDGLDLSGGVTPLFVQMVTRDMAAGGTATTGSITLAAAADSLNRAFGAFVYEDEVSGAAGSGFTQIHNLAGGTLPPQTLLTEWNEAAFDTTVDAAWFDTVLWGGYAFELSFAPAGVQKAASDSGTASEKATVATGAYSAAVLDDTPALYWRLGEASGLPQDSSGNALHATTLQGTPTYDAADLIATDGDGAMSFTAAQGVATPDNPAIDINSNEDRTVELWFKGTTAGAVQVLVSKKLNISTNVGWVVYFDASNNLVVRVGSITDSLSVPGGAYLDGNPHHLVWVRDATNDILRMYVDGVQVDSDTGQAPTDNWANSVVFRVGYNTTDGGFVGTIDEVAFYPTALSSTRITAHYDTGKPTGLAKTAFDSATAADTSALTAALPATDTAVGADTVPTLAKAVTDAAVGTESIPIFAKSTTDLAAAVDTSQLQAGNLLTANDSATATDVVTGRGLALADAATAADAMTTLDTGLVDGFEDESFQTDAFQSRPSLPGLAEITSTLGALTQAATATTNIGVFGTEAATAADVVSGRAIAVPDSAVAADVAPTLAKPGTDSATSSDVVVDRVVAVVDAAVGADASALAAATPVATDNATGVESVPTFAKATTDAISAADVAVLTTAASVVDSATAADTAAFDAALTRTDAATASDTALVTNVPQNLIAVAVSTNEIDLTWDVFVGATAYDIERDGAIIAFDIPTNAYDDIGLSPNTLYTYRVRAVV